MIVTLYRDFTFEAAHRNCSAGASEANSRLHGHSYRARVKLTGPVDPHLGWLVDFGNIKQICAPVIGALDHRNLNDVEGMTSTSLTDVQRWIATRLCASVPLFTGCEVAISGDTCFKPVVRQPDDPVADIKHVGFGFAAAHFLPQLPQEHKCHRMHGHSFRLTVAGPGSAQEELIRLLGEIYRGVDHRLLNKIAGLENPTSEYLARWFWMQLDGRGYRPGEILVRETCTTGCIFRGED